MWCLSWLSERRAQRAGTTNNPNFDCLHYCTPGPDDVVSELLYNNLRWLLAK